MKKLNVKAAVMNIAATGGGAVAAASLNKIAIVGSQKPAIRGAIKIALGAFGPQLLGKGKKAALLEGIGSGMIAVGALELANATVFKSAPLAIAGVPGMDSRVYVDTMSGAVPTLGKVVPTIGKPVPTLNGVEPYQAYNAYATN